jgi:hypothetical protein
VLIQDKQIKYDLFLFWDERGLNFISLLETAPIHSFQLRLEISPQTDERRIIIKRSRDTCEISSSTQLQMSVGVEKKADFSAAPHAEETVWCLHNRKVIKRSSSKGQESQMSPGAFTHLATDKPRVALQIRFVPLRPRAIPCLRAAGGDRIYYIDYMVESLPRDSLSEGRGW